MPVELYAGIYGPQQIKKQNNKTRVALLAIIDKYDFPFSQWAWLYQTLLEVSMNNIAVWINVCADDWTAKRAIIASNEKIRNYRFARYAENSAKKYGNMSK